MVGGGGHATGSGKPRDDSSALTAVALAGRQSGESFGARTWSKRGKSASLSCFGQSGHLANHEGNMPIASAEKPPPWRRREQEGRL